MIPANTKKILLSLTIGLLWNCKHDRSTSDALGSTQLDSKFVLAGRIDNFCPNYKSYDPYNSYIMGLYANFTYLNLRDTLAILTGEKGKPIEPKSSNVILGAGFALDKVRFFSSKHPNGATQTKSEDVKRVAKQLDLTWRDQPLPREFCEAELIKKCLIPNAKDSAFCETSYPGRIPADGVPPIASKDDIKRELDLLTRVEEYRKGHSNSLAGLAHDLPKDAALYEPRLRLKYEKRVEMVNSLYNLTREENKWTLKILVDEYDSGKRTCEYWLHHPRTQSIVSFQDTQATWVETDDYAVLAFRGTEAPTLNGNENPSILDQLGSQKDILTDMLFRKVDCFSQLPENSQFYWPSGIGEIHRGFCGAALASVDWVSTRLKGLDSKKKLFITGHSLGGAIATILYSGIMRGISEKREAFSKVILGGLYTYGSPRVGNEAFANEFTKMAKQSNSPVFRQVNFNDFVTRAPYFNFYHVGELHWHPNLGREWLINPKEHLGMSPLPKDMVEGQIKLLKTVDEIWSLPYLSALMKIVSDPDTLMSQFNSHKLDGYISKLWNSVNHAQDKGGGNSSGVRDCKIDASLEKFNDSGFLSEVTIRNH